MVWVGRELRGHYDKFAIGGRMVWVAGMVRKLRLEEEGGIYHVINRGNYRQ